MRGPLMPYPCATALLGAQCPEEEFAPRTESSLSSQATRSLQMVTMLRWTSRVGLWSAPPYCLGIHAHLVALEEIR